jgi:hypothetical protein
MKTLLPFFLLLAATTWLFAPQDPVRPTVRGPVLTPCGDGTPIPPPPPPPPPGPKQQQ